MNTKKKSYYLLFIIIMSSFLLYSFSKKDSLVIAFEQTNKIEDKGFTKALLMVYDLSDYGYHNKAEELGNELLNVAIKNQSLPRQALSYFVLAYNYKKNGELKKALAYYEKSLLVREKMNDQKSIAEIYSNMSNIHYDIGSYKEALSCQKKSLSIRMMLNDQRGTARSLSIIGNIYSDQKKYRESTDYYNRALVLSEKADDSLNMSNTLISMGIVKHKTNEYDSAYYYFNRSLSYSLPNNKYSTCHAYRGIGTYYTKKKHYHKAEYYIKKSLTLAEEIDVPLEITLSRLELAQLYLTREKHQESIELLNKTLTISTEINFTKGIMLSDKFLSEAYEKINDFELALKHHKQYKILNDSLSLLEEKMLINDLQTQIKIDEKTYQLKSHHIKQKNKWIVGIIALGFLIILTITYLLFRSKNRKKAFDLSLKEKENQSQEKLILGIQRERKRISQDVHDDLGASISGMQIFTEMITDKITTPELKNDLSKLLLMQKEITSKVREVIWFIRNEDDLLENLIKYCKNYGENLFNNYPINISVTIPGNFSDIKISENDRKHLFLSYKEVLNNIVKHSKADKVLIKFEIKNNIFSVQIKDNGKGFNTQSTSSFSYGLKNIKSRIDSINGHIDIESNQNGTLVKLEKDYSDLSYQKRI